MLSICAVVQLCQHERWKGAECSVCVCVWLYSGLYRGPDSLKKSCSMCIHEVVVDFMLFSCLESIQFSNTSVIQCITGAIDKIDKGFQSLIQSCFYSRVIVDELMYIVGVH